MKKALVFCMALVLCLGALAGCGKGGLDYKGEIKEGFVYENTEISPDAVVLTVNGVDITAEEYFYWIGYGCGQLSYYVGDLDWTQGIGSASMEEYVKSEAVKTAAFYAVVEKLAEDNKVKLSEEELAAVDADMASNAEYYGGMEGYSKMLEDRGASLSLMTKLNRTASLYNRLKTFYLDESSPIHPTKDALNDYAAMTGAYTVKHVLFDIRTCSEEEAAEKLSQAEEILTSLDNRGEADLVALFDGFVSEYGEDPGMTAYPNGYTFKDSDDATLVAGFAETSRALGEYEYSDVLVTDFGYHIILRLPTDLESLAGEYFDVFLQEELTKADIAYSDVFESISAQGYYEALEALWEKEAEESGE